MDMMKKLYDKIIRPLFLLSLTLLTGGLIFRGIEYTYSIEIIKLGLWTLFILPFLAIITLFYQAIKNRDITLITVSIIIFLIIIVNLILYGLHNIPFTNI
jgi:uncharacterized membrane protein